MTDTRELVERLKVVARCGTDSTMRHSAYAFMAQDPDGDYVTYSSYAALSERCRVLEEALAPFSFMDSDEYDDLNDDQMVVIQVASSEETLMEMTVENFRKAHRALAALTSGGRG